MIFAVSQSPLELLPEPDPSAEPTSAIDSAAILSLVVELGEWVKVRSVTAPLDRSGWVRRDCLVPFEPTGGQSYPLFTEPFGDAGPTVAGGFLRRLIALPGWWKVQLATDAGAVATGWIVASATPPKPKVDPVREPDPVRERGPRAEPQASGGNLNLGINEVYRETLLKANTRTGIDAAALAALVDAEASRIRIGPEKGRWDPRAFNASSGAAGLTQFVADTWVGHAAIAGTALREAAQARGLVDASGRPLAGRIDALLELRFDAALSILSAAEYGVMNLKGLVARGFVGASEPDDRKAWFMYLAHHEGLSGASGFLRGDRIYSRAALEGQVGNDKAAALLSAHGDANTAYRAWLKDYIDLKITPDRFRSGETPRDVIPGGKVAASLGRDGVLAYTAIGTDAQARLREWRGEPIPFASIGRDIALSRALQEALSTQGYLDPPADGEFGPVSQWAIAAFARSHGFDLSIGLTSALAERLADPEGGLPAIRPSGQWIDRVIAAMRREGHFICRHPECRNIVYVEGMGPNGDLNADRPNEFNDCRIVFQFGPDGTPSFAAWDATTEPGDYYTNSPMDPRGAARIAFGQYKAWAVGEHLAGRPSHHEALVQTKEIPVHRDFNKDHSRIGDKVDRGLFGVNQHWGYDAPPNDIKNTSAGCLVGRTRDGHRAFMASIKEDARFRASRGYRFVTAVLAGDRLDSTNAG